MQLFNGAACSRANCEPQWLITKPKPNNTMTKDEIIEALTELNIEHDPSNKKDDLAALLPTAEKPVKKVIRFCGKQPICEGGQRYEPGDRIEITAERAAALGSLITAHEPA